MGTIDTLLRIKADASAAVRGLAPLQASLQNTATEAQKTETALDQLSSQHTISVNDQAIENARVEVERLRTLMRDQLRIDPQADTRDAQRKISQLQRSIKTLDATEATVDVAVNADATGLLALKAALAEVQTGFVEGAAGGLIGNSTAAASAVRLLGASGVTAAAGVLAVGAAAGIAAKGAWELGEAAADVETSVSQLNALTGGKGIETFASLQAFAKDTPFELDEVTAATKRLVAAGVDLDEIPQQLTDIGNVAAATGVPLEQIATVFAQMESKGKLTFEETQQLAEAGIPVWQTLADKLGLTVAQVQKLATEGKLGAEAVDLLRVSLGEEFPTAMTDQAETFNGMMSTLNDTMSQMGAELGTLFLPTMKDIVGAMQDLADIAETGVGWLIEFNQWVDEISGKDIVGNLLGAIPGVGPLINSLSDSEEEESAAKAEEAAKKSDELAASITLVSTSAINAQQAIQDQADTMERLADNVESTQETYEDLVESFNTFHDGLIAGRDAVYDYQGAIDDLAESLVKDNTFSPDKEAGRENWDNLVALAEDASQRVEDTWKTKGKGAAVAQQEAFRKTMAQMLIDSGISADEAWRLVNQVLEKPHEVNVTIGEIDVADLNKDLAKLREERATIEAKFVIPEGATEKDAQRILDEEGAALKPIEAKINAKVGEKKEAKDELDGVAEPDGKARKAPIKAVADTTQAGIDLDNFIKLRRSHVKIYVDLVPTGVPGGEFFGLGGPTAGPTAAPTAAPAALRTAGAEMLASPTATPYYGPRGPMGTVSYGGGGGVGGAQQQVTRIAPKQVPVAVYLDGVEIAARIEGRRAAAAVESVRRSA